MHGYLLSFGFGARDAEVAERLSRRLRTVCSRVTVIGPDSVLGVDERLADVEPMLGVLSCLGEIPWGLQPVFVLSSEYGNFDPRLVESLLPLLERNTAVLPEIAGKPQPFCALYSPQAFAAARRLVAMGERRVLAWMEAIQPLVVQVDGTSLARGFR